MPFGEAKRNAADVIQRLSAHHAANRFCAANGSSSIQIMAQVVIFWLSGVQVARDVG
jgi:hypothetical protein